MLSAEGIKALRREGRLPGTLPFATGRIAAQQRSRPSAVLPRLTVKPSRQAASHTT